VQIAIFVLPAMVILAWIWGKDFSLDFDPFAGLILTLSVVHAYFVSSDGNSNWLMGVQLLGTYTLIALLYLFLQNSDDHPKDALGPALGPGLAPAALLGKILA
jgi:Ca2+:H+ antiporter